MARRVTITLDDELAEKLEAEAGRRGTSLDQAVNEAVRKMVETAPRQFVVEARDMGKPLIDLDCTGRALGYLDELERKK
ncbi:MAG: ribbon-helix-helix protein, CopG family [Acidobacteriota bacterium]|nr:ribbon-helix-helix protein, CopG family [Acidobacteriota bacterium]